jgi:protein-S-isoprenylcysteine O-methyltransferase Ste14
MFTIRYGRDVLRVIIFTILSAALAYVSRASLKVPHSHGFYRFLAWECILALFFLNFISFQEWFGNPLSVRQIISWLLLISSIVPAVCGLRLLHARGKPDERRSGGAPTLWIEKTTQLVTSDVFKYIRHPLHSSLLLLAWGVFFKRPSWVAGGAVLGATAFLLATAKVEEVEKVRYFGAAYRTYMQHTKMFIPFMSDGSSRGFFRPRHC